MPLMQGSGSIICEEQEGLECKLPGVFFVTFPEYASIWP